MSKASQSQEYVVRHEIKYGESHLHRKLVVILTLQSHTYLYIHTQILSSKNEYLRRARSKEQFSNVICIRTEYNYIHTYIHTYYR